MKYIDADRLRAEIEKRLKNTRDYMNGAGMKYKGPKHFKAQGKESAYDALLNIIDSLQQEQPDFPTTDEEIEMFLATHPKVEVPDKYKTPDWLFKKQEQPEVFDTVAFQKGVQEGRRLERENVKSTIQSRIDGILGDAQPKPALRAELQELIKKIEA